MESGYSVANSFPPAFSPDYSSYLFNHPDHLRLQADEWLSYYLLRNVNQKAMAQVSFHLQNKKALTPVRAPFGSFLFSERLSPQVLYEFIQHCEEHLRKKGIKSICITEPPLYYRQSGELLQTILLNLDYRISKAELSSGIRVDSISFEEKIEAWEKRKLKQSKMKGLTCKALPLSELENVYNFILRCRQQRGHSLSMTLEELTETVITFKKSFFLFVVHCDKEMAAASIAIQVNRSILYNFYSGHLKKFDALSPVVLLTGAMHKFCATHQIQLLDLGTSAINGQPNFRLLDFKLRLGAVPSMKLSFEKELV